MGTRRRTYYRKSARAKARLAAAAKKRPRIQPRPQTRSASRAQTAATACPAGDESGLEVRFYGEKGRGVATTRAVPKGLLVVEYLGDLVSRKEGLRREETLAADQGCFLFFFAFKGRQYCIDATAESGHLGRLVNHARTRPNLFPRLLEGPDGAPRLFLVASRDIAPGEELSYDYGETRATVIADHPWLRTS